jgi:hypothetical protein
MSNRATYSSGVLDCVAPYILVNHDPPTALWLLFGLLFFSVHHVSAPNRSLDPGAAPALPYHTHFAHPKGGQTAMEPVSPVPLPLLPVSDRVLPR